MASFSLGQASSSWLNPFPMQTEPLQQEQLVVDAGQVISNDTATVCALMSPIVGGLIDYKVMGTEWPQDDENNAAAGTSSLAINSSNTSKKLWQVENTKEIFCQPHCINYVSDIVENDGEQALYRHFTNEDVEDIERRTDLFDIIAKDFSVEKGKVESRIERNARGLDEVTLTYGEIEFKSFF